MNPHPGDTPRNSSTRVNACLPQLCKPTRTSSAKPAMWVAALVITAAGSAAAPQCATAHAAPAPEVEYTYDVMVRRHFNFGNADQAITYGHGICDKVSQGESYAHVIGDVKHDVMPNDEFAANYLVSYAVNLLCPAEIWQLRNSAAGYQPPAQ